MIRYALISTVLTLLFPTAIMLLLSFQFRFLYCVLTLNTILILLFNLTVYDWSAADYNSINSFFESFDWHLLFGYNFDVDALWSGFKNIIWPVICLYVPQKIIPHNRKYNPHHYPKHIRKLLTRKAAIIMASIENF